MDKEDIEQMRISPITIVQLQRILNYLVKNEDYEAQLGKMQITYQGNYEVENDNKEVFTLYRDKED